MDFTLTEEQKMLRDVAREWLANHCPKSLVREMESDPKGYSLGLWQGMAENGWPGLVIPEEYGGAGMSFLDLVVLLEEMGRACLPGPYFSTVVLAGYAILEAGSEAQKKELLPQIARGGTVATLALTEPDGRWDCDVVETKAAPVDGGFVLNGVKLFVPDAHVSDLIVTVAKTEQGVTLFLVDARSRGITVNLLDTIAGDKQCEVIFDQVRVPSARLLGEMGKGWDVVETVLQKAAVAKCAESLGGAQQTLEMTVNYTKERVQFGRPIGSFQAIQHHCANMASDVDGCRLIAYQAAWKLAQGLPAASDVAMAKAWTSEAYRHVTALGQQVHGAMGFTMEYDMQLYYRRAKTAEVLFGDAEHHRETIAREMGL